MSSSFLAPMLPPHAHRHLSICGQPLLFSCEARLEVLPVDAPKINDSPLIQNYYCHSRAGQLVKITIIRIGKEVLQLTDRITLSRPPASEEDDKTKCGSNSSQPEVSSQRDSRPKRVYFSKSAKTLLSTMEQWAKENDPVSLHAVTALSQDYASEGEVVDFLAGNPIMREAFLAFYHWLFRETPHVRVEKLASRWMKRCQAAQEHERLREDYIQQVLEKM